MLFLRTPKTSCPLYQNHKQVLSYRACCYSETPSFAWDATPMSVYCSDANNRKLCGTVAGCRQNPFPVHSKRTPSQSLIARQMMHHCVSVFVCVCVRNSKCCHKLCCMSDRLEDRSFYQRWHRRHASQMRTHHIEQWHRTIVNLWAD